MPPVMTPKPDATTKLLQIEHEILRQLRGQVQQVRLEVHDGGLILRGRAYTFYGKQLILHAVQKLSPLPVVANRVEVR